MADAKTLHALLELTTIDDHEEVLKTCNAALKQSKNDINLLHIRFVALLKLDRYDDALRVLEESGDKLKQKAKVERAYALYKLGELDEAKSIAKSVANDRGARHVEAQASYRSEDFANAAILYKNLAGLDHEESDLRINSGATDAQLEWKQQGELVAKKKPTREDLEAFETTYNVACGSIARGELAQGEVLLKRAKDLCKSLDDLSEQEKSAELLPIMVQQLYVLSKLGKTEEAERLASDIELQEIPDFSTRQIARNNLLTSTPSTNPYLSHRILQTTPALPKTDTHFAFQSSRLHENSLATSLLASKPASVIKATPSSGPTTSPHTNTLSVLHAAAQAQSQLGKLGLKKILPLFQKRPKDIGLAMTIMQLYMLTNAPGAALTVLESLLKNLSTEPQDADILHAPGLVALQVCLYTLQNRKKDIKTALAKAASYWRYKSKPPLPTTLLQAAGLTLLESSDQTHQDAARDIFSTLHATDPSSPLATAGYIAAHTLPSPSHPPPQIPQSDLSNLPPIATLTTTIPTTHLEQAGIPPNPLTHPPHTTNTQRKRPAPLPSDQPKKKRLRKSRLPKGFEAGKSLDPERWLPLRERSTYRPKKKRGKEREREREKMQGGVERGGEGKGGEREKEKEKAGVVVGAGGGGGKGKGKKKGRK